MPMKDAPLYSEFATFRNMDDIICMTIITIVSFQDALSIFAESPLW